MASEDQNCYEAQILFTSWWALSALLAAVRRELGRAGLASFCCGKHCVAPGFACRAF